VLARTAGISEPILYDHFESKDALFREVVELSVEKRLRHLELQLASIAQGTLRDCVESLAQATITECIRDGANAVLTCWALLEAPQWATDLHRIEAGRIQFMWERKLAECRAHSASHIPVSLPLVSGAVQACLAYGLWLTALRHSAGTAAPLAREFASVIAQALLS
jgi:AcrR family transcriptional regulator